jgi:hypothetical protein
MNEIDRGLYQSLLSDSLVEQLQGLDARLIARKSDLHVELAGVEELGGALCGQFESRFGEVLV